MKVVIGIVLVLVLVVAIVAIVGWSLPVAHVASASGTVAKPPDAVYPIIADLHGYRSWWSDDPGIKSEVVEARPPSRLVTRIADPDQPFGGTWTFDIVPDGAGSRVTITENGEVYNPIFRFVSRFVFGHTATMESFLAALKAR
jgi:uncharacterized protein YndB with AHSA1/START domain